MSTPMKFSLSLFLVLHAEALLLVDDDKAEVMELHVLGQQPMGAHHDVHTARLQAPEGLLLLFCGAEAGHHLHLHGEGFHAGKNGVVVLPRQQGGGGKDGALLAAHHALEGGAQGHFGLAHAHVAAQQAVHGPALFHVLLDLGGGVQLVVCLVVVKAGLKVPLPVAVRREGVARGLTAAGVELDQFLRHLLGGIFLPWRGCAATRHRPALPALPFPRRRGRCSGSAGPAGSPAHTARPSRNTAP